MSFGIQQMSRHAFGRFSVAIVTPFLTPAENSLQPINQLALERLIESVSDGLSKVKTKLHAKEMDESIIGGLEPLNCHLFSASIELSALEPLESNIA
jgi:hypothetical protein